MSKGGSTTSQVQIPSYLSDAARRNLSRASQISNIGYTPYYGADVAAMTPMQQASMQGTNQMASAFGLPSVSNPMAGMPQSQDFGGMQAYSSAPMYEQSLQSLAQNRPEQYQAIESMFNPTGGTNYGGGYGGGNGGGNGYGTDTGGGVNLGNLAGTALAGYGAYKALPAVASKVGGLLGIGGANAANAANAVVRAGSNLVPGTGIIKAGGDGFNYVYGGTLKNPALQGMAQQQIAANAAGQAAGQVAGQAAGQAAGQGLAFGALPTASQLAYIAPYLALPFLVDPIGKHVISPIADALGFGSKERAKRAELAKWSEQSGLNDYKSMVESVSGMPYGDYIESKRPPLSPYDADLQALRNSGAGDMSYEEDELATRYQYGAGKQSMDNFYAANPDWYTPTGERIYPEGKLGDMDRQAAAWFAGGQQGQNPMSGTINNVINRNDYPILSRSRNGLL